MDNHSKDEDHLSHSIVAPELPTTSLATGETVGIAHHLQFSEDEPTDFALYPDDYQEQCFSLETQDVHSVTTQPPKKRYFV